ncbi:MAG: hypothetical protein ABI675_19625 [Chitinophagaceae bacterium]
MEEIKAILKREDIAAFIVIHTPGHSEYLNHLETSYSCAKIQFDQVRLKLKSSEVGRERAKEIAKDTLNMVTHIAKATGQNSLFYMDCSKLLKDKFGGEDLPGEETSHSQQNN